MAPARLALLCNYTAAVNAPRNRRSNHTRDPKPTQPPPPTPFSPLECFPIEVQRLILIHASTFSTLRTLVYAADRPRILRGFLAQTLDGLLVDTHAAYLSGTDEFQLTREVPVLWEFLHAYEQRWTAVKEGEDVAGWRWRKFLSWCGSITRLLSS
ncbi:hypothetical protein C8A05DRAFT_35013 [Staphylotrichum tortipilum]|uniref:Uncharacterized protein n=1 Tax=Staphylotrichum tortipilum TaxID=2831512 RepID=A0AAN6RSW2_9PEZI|nr:hypothetical protein C8A05DRAFT_35013 [Staphylotrichum longicolle]